MSSRLDTDLKGKTEAYMTLTSAVCAAAESSGNAQRPRRMMGKSWRRLKETWKMVEGSESLS